MISRLVARLNSIPDTVWLQLLILLGLILRLADLSSQSLWFDEAFSWLVASQPVPVGLEFALINFVHPPLYYLLLHLVMHVSHHEFVLRFPSAFLGTLSIPLMYKLGCTLAVRGRARATGLLAAVLLAFNPFHVWFSREARNYQLVFFLSALLLFLFQQLTEGRERWTAFVIVSGLSYVTHYLALLMPLAQFLYFLTDFRRRYRLFRRWFLAQALAGLPLGLWMIALFTQEQQSIGIAWIPRPMLITPLLTLWDFALLYAERWLPLGTFALPFFAMFLFIGLQPRHQRGLLVLWLCVPPLTLLAVSWITKRSFYVDRYLITSLPAFVLILARGVTHLIRRTPRWIVGAATTMLLLSSALSVGQIFWDKRLAKSDWRSVGRLLQASCQADDLVVLRTVEDSVPLYYYSDLQRWSVADVHQPDLWTRAQGHRLWLIWSSSQSSNHLTAGYRPINIDEEATPVIQAWLIAHRDQVLAEYTFSGILVILVNATRE